MADKINKDFLINVRFSDLSIAWALQARGFYYSAQAVLRGNTIMAGKKFVSGEEAYLARFGYKTACYLLAHSIELSLKAIYCQNGGTKPEKYSHRMPALLAELVAQKLIDTSQVDTSVMDLIDILLAWYGRYHKPKDIQKVVQELYIQSPEDPNMLEKKFPITEQSYQKLLALATLLIKIVPLSPSSIAPIIFDPF